MRMPTCCEMGSGGRRGDVIVSIVVGACRIVTVVTKVRRKRELLGYVSGQDSSAVFELRDCLPRGQPNIGGFGLIHRTRRRLQDIRKRPSQFMGTYLMTAMASFCKTPTRPGARYMPA